MVDSVKRAISKNPSNWKRELQDFLYSYRYTPCSSAPEGKSPAELFFGRRINSPFSKLAPTTIKLPPISTESIIQNQLAMQQQFKQHHGARRRTLNPRDRVVVALKDKLEQGYIENVLSNSRYLIRLDSGKLIERHINHIWKGGDTREVINPAVSDDWIFYEPNPGGDTCEPQPCPAVAPSRDLVNQPEPATSGTSSRPCRQKSQPRRLVLDPKAKSYTQW